MLSYSFVFVNKVLRLVTGTILSHEIIINVKYNPQYSLLLSPGSYGSP